MSKKKLKIIGTILAFALGFPLHFLYDKLPNFITSIISPVNESIWEHMKLLFTSIIISSIIQKIIVKMKKEELNNICFSNFIAAISAIPIFLIIFLPIYKIIGENMIVNIIIMLITIIISQIISSIIMNKNDLNLEKITIFLVLIVYLIFGILTYNPIKSDLFIDKKTETYGIPK